MASFEDSSDVRGQLLASSRICARRLLTAEGGDVANNVASDEWALDSEGQVWRREADYRLRNELHSTFARIRRKQSEFQLAPEGPLDVDQLSDIGVDALRCMLNQFPYKMLNGLVKPMSTREVVMNALIRAQRNAEIEELEEKVEIMSAQLSALRARLHV